MKNEKEKPQKEQDAKELLRAAFFDLDDEIEPGAEAGLPAEDDNSLRRRLLNGFASHLQRKAEECEGEDKKAVRSALRSVKSQIAETRPSVEKTKAVALSSGRKDRVPNYWTNSSVKVLAGPNVKGEGPVKLITQKARDLIFEYVQNGGISYPLDPFDLARFKNFKVETCEDVRDARTLHAGGGRFLIQYNPKQPLVRIRFSICHEITHTIFPDCAVRVQNRGTHEGMEPDEWQLESLCDVGAAELLMPIGSFKEELEKESLSLDPLLNLKDKLQVSAEALLLRIIKLTQAPSFVFSASRADRGVARYKIDYSFRSQTFNGTIPYGLRLPHNSVVAGCTRFGFTDKAQEIWHEKLGALQVECMAVSPYPGSVHPRVMGIAIPVEHEAVIPNYIHYVKGDATQPRGGGHHIIAQIVNDKAALWGGGFALVVRRKWPEIQKNFYSWAMSESSHLKLGNSHLSTVNDTTDVFHMICQRGYNPTPKPSIRYGALKTCLDRLAQLAVERNASVHMPRIGCGQAGGNWNIVSEMITYFLCERGIKVTIYDPPGTEFVEKQPTLF
jgi:O-acetyl-ADP-ribose deacetylase (regulator of RNase III)